MSGVRETRFGIEVEDAERWLEDGSAPDVQKWMLEQDLRARAYLGKLPEREALRERLREVLYVEHQSVPVRRANRYFFSIKPRDAEKAIHYVRDGKRGVARVLLDPNQMSEDGSLSVGAVVPSRDGRWIAYFEHPNNADESTLKVLDVDSGAIQPIDTIDGLRYTFPSWSPDGKGFLYTWVPSDSTIPSSELMAHAEVRYHRLGTDPRQDELVHPSLGDPSRFVHASFSPDGRVMLLHVSDGWSRNDVYVRSARSNAPWRPVAVGKQATFSVEAFGGFLFIRTDEGAARFRVFRTEVERPGSEHWTEIVAEDPRSVLQDVEIVGGKLALRYLKNAYTQLQLRELDGRWIREIPLPDLGTASNLVGLEDQDEAFFEFSSMTRPSEIYELSVASGRLRRIHRANVPVNPSAFEVRQEWFPSRDGTQVPLFLAHRRGLRRTGKHPTLLTGYGGFGVSLLPRFMATLYPWLERGGVFAMANLRGGGEFGEAWHRAGMLHEKQNVFDDFIAAADHLIESGYTRPELLGISGRSNGGLLVGAAMTQRPERFGAVLCGVPLLDMVRFADSGLGSAWVPEYGNPENPGDFRVLHAYSPYHQLRPGVAYPPLLMLSADTDDRVDPMHARKFVARLEALGNARVWLRIERNAGHGGADMREQLVARVADEYAFLLQWLDPSKYDAESSTGSNESE